jgi:hypothetical protein
MSKPIFKPPGLTLDLSDDEKEEPILTEQEIIENIKTVYEQYPTSDKLNTSNISNTITKLYDIIDLNKPNVNTVENINKIIEVYEKEVTVQKNYVKAVEESNLNDQICIPKIIDHGIIFVKDNNNESLPNNVDRVKSFGKYLGSKRERTIGIGLEYEKENPRLKRHFFEYDLENMSYDVENMSEEDKNKIIYNNILEREDDNGVKHHDKFDNEYIEKSFSLFYFIQMERVPKEYELWSEFKGWPNKKECDTQLNNLKTNLKEEITKPAGYVHGDINSSNIFVKKEGDNYKYALIDFGEATEIYFFGEDKSGKIIDNMFEEKNTLQCPTDEELLEEITERVEGLELGGKKKTKRNRINKKRKTYKRKKTKTSKNINKKNKTKKQFLYNPDDPKKSFDVYIDKDLTDTIPIKYATIDDVKTTIKTLEKLYKQNKYSHKRIWQVGMIMKVRLEAMLKHKDKLYPNAKNVKSRFDLANKYFLFLRSRTKEKDEKKRKEMKFNH